MKVKFLECVEYMIKGPFGSDMKKSLYVPKGEDTYKVYVQGNAIQKDENLGDYYVSSEYFHRKLERFQVHPGDYIITCDGTLGKYIKLSENIEPGVISSSLLLLKLDETKIYDKFFELIWENSMLKYLASQARNACLVHLPSAKAIGDVEIELPEMSIQREIADKAFLIKDILNKRNEELCLLDELIKARFVELMDSTELSDETTIEAITKQVKVGFVGTCEKYYTDNAGVPMIRTGNITDKGIVLKDLKYVTREFHEQNEKSQIHTGDLLIARHGSNGQANVYFGLDAQCLNAVVIVPNQSIASSVFLAGLINSPMVKEQIERTLVGSTQRVVNTKSIANLKVRVPNITVQKQYEEFVKQVDKSKLLLLMISNYLCILTRNTQVIFTPLFVTLHHRK